ncbi:MAG TPA: response regulator [Thermomicrobiales bacterium]|nr:response regulator [Thermomicrobiales bacterium]
MADDRRVLVVDDDDDIREVLVAALREDGYAVREAGSGRQALDILAAWPPDLILLDLMMPEMDGRAFRAGQRERGLAAGAPLIVVSASRWADDQARELGAVAGVAKPFDLLALLALVQRTIDDRR